MFASISIQSQRIGADPGRRLAAEKQQTGTLPAVQAAMKDTGPDRSAVASSLSLAPADSLQPHVPLSSSGIAFATGQTIHKVTPQGHKPRVAYQGVPGAYSEGAASTVCPDHEPLPCAQFEVAFQALSQWMAERACIPIENSLGGSIHTVYDLLLRYNLHIVGEKSISISHCLMAKHGVSKSDITRVLSHPQALAQCDQYLRQMQVVKEAVDDTAGAAQLVSQEEVSEVTAAIASSRAAELYGLQILDEGIQDKADNFTRFIVLSRDPLVSSVDESKRRLYKTSVVFSLAEGPGQLFKALSVFALRDIDMTFIQSRPLRTQPLVVSQDGQNRQLNYLFYVDVLAPMAEERCQNALKHLQEIAPFVRVLGSFPADTEDDTS
eukprot:jgi/Ulvmu1/8282/UM041_0094.1